MYLGLDIGTSGVKTCVIDQTGDVMATSHAALSTSHPFESASEQHCDQWWQAVQTAVAQLDAGIRDRIAAIGLSGQMHGAVVLDAAHRPLRPAILWNDGRADAQCRDMLSECPDIGTLTGAPPMPGFTAPKLRWLAAHEPQTHARIAHVLLPKDYIGLKLHGGCVTDPSDASGTGWLDQNTRGWSSEMCEISATDPAWLPDIRTGETVAGQLRAKAAEALGLIAGIPVVTGAGDAAAGAIGIGACQDEDGFLSLGTSGQLFVTTTAYRPNPESRVHAYAHTLPDLYFQMAAMLNGARPMAWLSDLLQRPIPDLLQEAATARPGPLFLPYLVGERTPHGDTTIRGGFAMLSETTTQGSLMLAVLEAIAFTFADAMDALNKAGTTPTALLAIGGGTRSDLLMQRLANVTGCRIGRSDGAEIGPALGAARLAACGVETIPLEEIIVKPEAKTVFEPRAGDMAQTADRLAAFRALYGALKQVQSLAAPS
jgi:xylulokinase